MRASRVFLPLAHSGQQLQFSPASSLPAYCFLLLGHCITLAAESWF